MLIAVFVWEWKKPEEEICGCSCRGNWGGKAASEQLGCVCSAFVALAPIREEAMSYLATQGVWMASPLPLPPLSFIPTHLLRLSAQQRRNPHNCLLALGAILPRRGPCALRLRQIAAYSCLFPVFLPRNTLLPALCILCAHIVRRLPPL